jgi:hypothetical protein
MHIQNSQVAPQGAGVSGPGPANQQGLVNHDICRYVKHVINELRSDIFLAITLDRIVEILSEPEDPVTADDVRACLRHDDTVKIINVSGKEVLWLWDKRYLHTLINRIAELATVGDVTIKIERTPTSETKNRAV